MKDPLRAVDFHILMKCMMLMSMLEAIYEEKGMDDATAYLVRQSGCIPSCAEGFIEKYIAPAVRIKQLVEDGKAKKTTVGN